MRGRNRNGEFNKIEAGAGCIEYEENLYLDEMGGMAEGSPAFPHRGACRGFPSGVTPCLTG